jgi:hypothetical protein
MNTEQSVTREDITPRNIEIALFNDAFNCQDLMASVIDK